MTRFEETFPGRFSGVQAVISSIGLGLMGYMSLQLYFRFGPKDGNPIGFGLLAIVSLPVAGSAFSSG